MPFFDCAGDGAQKASKKGRKLPTNEDGDNDDEEGGGGAVDIKDLDLDDLADQKADYLKELCRGYGLPVSGNKSVLIQRLIDLKNS